MPPSQSGSILASALNDRSVQENMRRLHRLATVGTLSAGLAHEIKNALVSSRTFIELLLEKQPDAELAEVVRREIARIEVLLSQMLRFAAPAKPALGSVLVHKLLDHSLRLVGRQLADKTISVVRDYAAASDLVQGDDYQLEQVFVNLFLNAADAMAPHGVLTVATTVEGPKPQPPQRPQTQQVPQLRITIKDTGLGIPEENLGRLFEPFFTTKEGRTGLGLSITRRIVEEHHGRITVQSQPAKGTVFQINLPALGRPG